MKRADFHLSIEYIVEMDGSVSLYITTVTGPVRSYTFTRREEDVGYWVYAKNKMWFSTLAGIIKAIREGTLK